MPFLDLSHHQSRVGKRPADDQQHYHVAVNESKPAVDTCGGLTNLDQRSGLEEHQIGDWPAQRVLRIAELQKPAAAARLDWLHLQDLVQSRA